MDEEEKQVELSEKKKWSLKKKLVVIFSLIVGIFIAIFVLASVATQAPLKASDEFLADIQAKNSSAAYSMFSAEAKGVVAEDEFVQVVEQIGPILNSKPKVISKEVSGKTGEAATAKVVYEIRGSDSITYTFTVNLAKDNGEWKIQNFDSARK